MNLLSTFSTDTDPLEFLNEHGLGALADRMGIHVTELSRERMVATMPVEGNTQPFGAMHGGAYVVLGESLGSTHANLYGPEGMYAVGIDVNATHTGSLTDGHVTAVCTPVHLGKTMAVHEVIISAPDGKRCSTVRITNFYRPRS